MKGRVGLYFSFAKIAIRSMLVYRSSFWAGLIAQWLSYGAFYATLYIMIKTFNVLAGWTAEEVLFLYALNVLSYAFAACLFFNPCTHLIEKIRSGEFDAALTKPVSPLGHEFYTGFNFGYVSHVTLSSAVMLFAVIKVGFQFNPLSILIFFLMFIGAVLVQAAFLIAFSAFGFFFISQNPMFDFFWGLRNFTFYPLSVFPILLQGFLTFVLPMAFMSFYPAAAILGKGDGVPFTPILAYLSPVVGICLFVLSIFFWNWALTKYQSTGN